MKEGTKLIKGQLYWINDRGSNMHSPYSGPGKCLSSKSSGNYCGGRAYMFKYPDPYHGITEGAFGLDDIVCAINNNFCKI